MTEARSPQAEHAQFDALCEGLDDYDALPSLRQPAAERAIETDEDGRNERLNDQILAALVSP